MEKYFVGTKLKIAFKVECDGFDMETDDWKATVKKGSKSIVCDKENNTAHDIDGWYLLIDSTQLGSGIDHYTYTYTVSGDSTIAVVIGTVGDKVFIKQNGSWVQSSKQMLKVSGTWKEINKVYEKVNGSWVEKDKSAMFSPNAIYIGG